MNEADTEQLPVLAATAVLVLGVFLPELGPRPAARHAARRGRDPQLGVAALALLACAALSGALVPYGLTGWAAAAWATGGVTALALRSWTDRLPSPYEARTVVAAGLAASGVWSSSQSRRG